MACETLEPPFITLPDAYSGYSWDGLTWTITSADGTEFAGTLTSAVFKVNDDDGNLVLTLSSSTSGEVTLNATSANAWSVTVEPRVITLSAGNYSWSLTTVDDSGIIKPRLVGTLQIKNI